MRVWIEMQGDGIDEEDIPCGDFEMPQVPDIGQLLEFQGYMVRVDQVRFQLRREGTKAWAIPVIEIENHSALRSRLAL